MDAILDFLRHYLASSAFGQFHWSNAVMILIGCFFIFLAIRKGFEPLLLVPIGFGILIGNIPYDASQLPLSVYDGPVSEVDIHVYAITIDKVYPKDDSDPITFADYLTSWKQEHRATLRDEMEADLRANDGLNQAEAREKALKRIPDDYEIRFDHKALMRLAYRSNLITLSAFEEIHSSNLARDLMDRGQAIMVNSHSVLTTRREVLPDHAPAIVSYGQGRLLFVDEIAESGRYPEVWSRKKQDPWSASVFWWLFTGVGLAGIFPPLIFLGIGALTDFGPMISNPKTLLLGAAAQFGIFGSFLGALLLGFTLKEAASIGIIGGADGPTAIFTCSQLAPDLLGAVALAAYSYMALVPIIQPPIIKLLTTPAERRIRMPQGKPVSKRVKIMFPVIGFLITAAFAPGGLPLLGMLFFGNLLRESMVTDRLARTAQTTFIDIVTILLGVTVGAKTSAPNFLTTQTIYIFVLGMAAFAMATAAGVLCGKLMNKLSRTPVNPMIGAAGVSAVPMAARVVQKLGQEADPQNFLLMHAMGPNVAGVIGSAVAAGVLLSGLAG